MDADDKEVFHAVAGFLGLGCGGCCGLAAIFVATLWAVAQIMGWGS